MATTIRKFVIAIALAGLGGATGCGFFTSNKMQKPSVFHPGNVTQQRLGAIAHDPYADPAIGPQGDGLRPREYSIPLAEPVRNRWLADSWWGR